MASVAVMYAAFSVSSFFAGSFVNIHGVKPALYIGSVCYLIYMIFLTIDNQVGFKTGVIIGGLVCGIGAGIFGTAQGAINLAYAD